jgi:hypothetical protein
MKLRNINYLALLNAEPFLIKNLLFFLIIVLITLAIVWFSYKYLFNSIQRFRVFQKFDNVVNKVLFSERVRITLYCVLFLTFCLYLFVCFFLLYLFIGLYCDLFVDKEISFQFAWRSVHNLYFDTFVKLLFFSFIVLISFWNDLLIRNKSRVFKYIWFLSCFSCVILCLL